MALDMAQSSRDASPSKRNAGASESYWTLADPAGNEVDIATTVAPE
jgi:hypothetical protein